MQIVPMSLVRHLTPSLLIALTLVTRTAYADTGVSDERVSLPDGPGSIGGIGENVAVDGNMGQMSFSVPFRVPEGFEGVTPQLGLSYDSGNGSSVAGIGWAFAVPSIERMTSRGLPEYIADDLFAADGGSELVRVSSSADEAVYRARHEGSFVRYRWVGVGDGKEGYWKAELPDGRVNYYGADRNGTLVASARVTHPNGGVFRYELVETVDPIGNRVSYGYVLSGRYPLLDTVSYVFGTDDKPRFSLKLGYADRPDVISDAKPGFELRLSRRLAEVRVLSGPEQIRGYLLSYEPEADSGGMSRLARVSETGRGGVMYPIRPTFGYSRALGGACKTNCEKPFMVDMGTLSGGVDMSTGTSTLIDINGDSLPDVLDTKNGTHTFYISAADKDGRPHFVDQAKISTATTSAFKLGEPGVQVLDVNGDGLTDMISSRTGAVLCNGGNGDWQGDSCIANSGLGFDLEDDPSETGESDPLHVRFFDYDNDRRIDLIRTTSDAATDVRRATPMGYEAANIQPIGAVFDASTLQLADMNGDGLQDPVELLSGGQLRFRLNLGRGTWSDWQTLTIAGFGDANFVAAQLDDINGDGLADIIVVAGNMVQYALNRNAAQFDPPLALAADAVTGQIPERTAGTTVLFADMNGNGSDDVVWISSDGHVQFLDLFPVKPNLLARIENGIGMVQAIDYGTALSELARDGSWKTKPINAMNLVKRVDMWVTLTGSDGGQGLHDVTEYVYRDGYYDGVDKQFRGFAHVERSMLADMRDSQEPGVTVLDYDVGASDNYRAGLLLRSDTFALEGTKRVALNSVRTTYDDCPIAEVPNSGLPIKVRFVCPTEEWTVEQERASEDAWRTVKVEREYDGYGNVSRLSELGLVNAGSPESPKACGECADASDVACGPECSGDESFTETEYVVPGAGGAWIVSAPSRIVTYGMTGGPTREAKYFYDGPAFEGLESGKLTRGLLSRLQSRITASGDDFVATKRVAYDSRGNPTSVLDPLGAPDDMTGHRINYSYDPTYGQNLFATEVAVSDAAGPYSLRREYTYDGTWNSVNEATEWMLVRSGGTATARDSTRYRYDEQGRVSQIVRPGDSDDAPTMRFAYELANPVTRVHIQGRSEPGAEPDSESIHCLDGRGRNVQVLTRISDGAYQANGFDEMNSRGAIVRHYRAYKLESDACAMTPPSSVPVTAFSYDAMQRLRTTTLPDAELNGGVASVEEVRYAPLTVSRFDAEDTAQGGAHANTPMVERLDGLNRLVSIERQLGGKDGSAVTRLRYDSLGNLRGYRDPEGNERTQEFDLLGRVTQVRDPNSGTTRFEYDANGNEIKTTDADGTVIRVSYDGLNRPLERWAETDRTGTLERSTYDALDCKDCTALPGRLAELRSVVVVGDKKLETYERYGYDARRNPVYAARSIDKHVFETRTKYDGLGRLVQTTYPDGQVVEQRFDGAGRLIEIPGVVGKVEYDEASRLSGQTHANGVQTTFAYDVRDWLTQQVVKDGAGKTLFDVKLTRDRAGNLTEVADAAPSRSGRISRGEKYEYDAWYRVAQARFGGEDSEQLSFGYDAIDRVLTRTSSLGDKSGALLGARKYDPAHPNALSQLGDLDFRYAATGELIQRGSSKLAWDHDNRLVKAERDGELKGAFGYAPDGERLVKDEEGHVVYYVGADFEVRDGVSAVYPQVGQERLARLESTALATGVLPDQNDDEAITIADAWLARDKKGVEVSQLLAASAAHVLFDPKATKTFLHQDHGESVIAATDSAGSLIAEQDFYGYGALRESTGFVDSYGFSGQELDSSTGFTHYPARYLDGASGTWISPDPLFEVVSPESMRTGNQAISAYTYVDNNWPNNVDPTGLAGDKTGQGQARPRANAVRGAAPKTRPRANAIRKAAPKAGRPKWPPPKGKGRARADAFYHEASQGEVYHVDYSHLDATESSSSEEASSSRSSAASTGSLRMRSESVVSEGELHELMGQLEAPMTPTRAERVATSAASTPRDGAPGNAAQTPWVRVTRNRYQTPWPRFSVLGQWRTFRKHYMAARREKMIREGVLQVQPASEDE
jgi:RHS repeat-associated protein